MESEKLGKLVQRKDKTEVFYPQNYPAQDQWGFADLHWKKTNINDWFVFGDLGTFLFLLQTSQARSSEMVEE